MNTSQSEKDFVSIVNIWSLHNNNNSKKIIKTPIKKTLSAALYKAPIMYGPQMEPTQAKEAEDDLETPGVETQSQN